MISARRSGSNSRATRRAVYIWRAKPDRSAEHDALPKEALQAERERCPEVLLHLSLGPAVAGAESRLTADEATRRELGVGTPHPVREWKRSIS